MGQPIIRRKDWLAQVILVGEDNVCPHGNMTLFHRRLNSGKTKCPVAQRWITGVGSPVAGFRGGPPLVRWTNVGPPVT